MPGHRVVVVGGSIAGLALAAALDPRRWSVTIVEEHWHRASDGAALGMWPAAVRALDRLGVGRQARSAAAPFAGGALLSSTGRVRLRVPPPRAVEPAAGARPGVVAPGMILVPRPRLLRLLDDAVPAAVERRTAKVQDLRGFRDADLIVGADGVHSTVRRSAWGEAFGARLLPIVAIRGHLGGAPGLPCETWGRHSVFGIAEQAGETTYWFASFGADPSVVDYPRDGLLARLRRRFAPFHRAVRETLARAEPDGLLVQMLWEAPSLAGYRQPAAAQRGVPAPVVLIGDAAHAMTPNLGRGAGEALVDACTLAEELNAHDDPHRAVLRYQARRYAPTRAVQLGSRAVMRLALSIRS